MANSGREGSGMAVSTDGGRPMTAHAGNAQSGLLDAVIESAPDGIMIFESVRDGSGTITDFRWTHANGASERIIGKPRSWFLGERLLEKMPGNREEGLFDAYRDVVETGRSWTGEFAYCHEGLDSVFKASAVKTGDGLVVNFSDLTEKRQFEDRLSRSEERLRLALDAAKGVGAWDWDLVSDSIFADDTFAALFGIAPEVARTSPPISVYLNGIHPDDREAVAFEIERTVAEGGDYAQEYRAVGADGEIKWVFARGSCIKDASGRCTRFPGVVFDITDRKTVEDAWRASEARFEAIVNSIDQLIWSARPDGNHDYYNSRWYEYTGVPEGSTDGEGWNGMFHPDDQERAWARWLESLDSGTPYHIEYRLRHRSGQYRWVIGRAQPVRDAHGRIHRWYGTCTDIHDLKMAEEQRELITRELSHRIKNIFALIMSLVTLSARTAPEAEPFANALRARIDALAHAHEFVRPGENPTLPDSAHQTVSGLFRALLAAYREADRDHIEIVGGDTTIGARSATTLALVFHELATNAIKYGALSSGAGRIRIHCSVQDDVLSIEWRETGGPMVSHAPSKSGFGTTMSRRAASAQLDASIEHHWLPEGLKVAMRIPLRALTE